jgi:hypothetical protein
VRHALAPLPGSEAVGRRRRGRRGEALHHAAPVAAAAGAGGRRVVLRVQRGAPVLLRLLLLLLLMLLDNGLLLPDAQVTGGPHDLRGAGAAHPGIGGHYYVAVISNHTCEPGMWTGLAAAAWAYLAPEGAEAEGVEEAALADLAGVGDALAWPLLRALVQEHHARAVDDVRLHAGDVQHLLDLRHPDHVVVGGPPYLAPPANTDHASPSERSRRWNRHICCQTKKVGYPPPPVLSRVEKHYCPLQLWMQLKKKSPRRSRGR